MDGRHLSPTRLCNLGEPDLLSFLFELLSSVSLLLKFDQRINLFRLVAVTQFFLAKYLIQLSLPLRVRFLQP